MLVDSHCHLNDLDLYPLADTLLEEAQASGVCTVLVPGYDRASSLRAIALAERFTDVYAAVGFHPQDAEQVTERDYDDLAMWCRHEKVVAIGEIGLDYHYDHVPRDVQQQVFSQQIALAKRMNKPVIIHDREAHHDVLETLRATDAAAIGGVLHCFSGSVEMMREAIDLNFYIGLGGPVTFKNAKKPVEVACAVPAERLLVETDAPWLAPVPHRGKTNKPSYVRLIAEHIANLRSITLEELGTQTTANARALFGLGTR
ncbi:TatD family hydrolase [Ferroacidibacillus organovorans]|uniref:Hydrolase TatD n=1 Tax=Ferroacidibacillus organovorans TaxID=1765683 RepID=A0A853KD15_9BACL|nr:TatD family hydrolase [Ferroacidibacillus organovorans]KYP81497.1 hydrolase TatD [Ferroacidibacillus organovorans]OAG94069.1 hydrolase TatD [Ferroacidibacillus organovorans]